MAIVGGGLAGFVAYLTLRRDGVEEITVFAPEPDPAAAWRRRAAAIRQTHMRSESDGHCLPTSFPGLAVRDARARRSLVPLVRSVCDRYHPTVDDFLAHVEELRVASGWDDSVVPARIERVSPVDGAFSLHPERLGPGSNQVPICGSSMCSSQRDMPDLRFRRSCATTRARCIPTRRTTTPTASASSARVSQRRPSGATRSRPARA